MDTRVAFLLLVAITATAGCSFPLGENQSTDQGPPTTSESVRSTPAMTDTPESSTSTTSTTDARFGQEAETGGILLSLPEMGQAYEFASETARSRADLNDSERESFEERGLLRRHDRVFTLAKNSGEAKPPVVISTAAVYESERVAAGATPDIVESIRDAGGSSQQVELASGINATRLSGETQTGRKNVLLFWQTDNLVIWVVTSGVEQFYTDATEEYFVEMVLDIPSEG